MGGDSLAAAVSQSFPVVLLLYSADTPQDAAGCLPATGSTMLSRPALNITNLQDYGIVIRVIVVFYLIASCSEVYSECRPSILSSFILI